MHGLFTRISNTATTWFNRAAACIILLALGAAVGMETAHGQEQLPAYVCIDVVSTTSDPVMLESDMMDLVVGAGHEVVTCDRSHDLRLVATVAVAQTPGLHARVVVLIEVYSSGADESAQTLAHLESSEYVWYWDLSQRRTETDNQITDLLQEHENEILEVLKDL